MDNRQLAAARRRSFGEQVRVLRLAARLSQRDLALSAGLHHTYVGAVERGERNVSMDAMWSLADALGVSLRDLLPPTPFSTQP